MANDIDETMGINIGATASGGKETAQELSYIEQAIKSLEEALERLNEQLASDEFLHLNAQVQTLLKNLDLLAKNTILKEGKLFNLEKETRVLQSLQNKRISVASTQALLEDKQLVKDIEKAKIDAQINKKQIERASLTAKNTKLEIQSLSLKTKQNNSLAKSKRYLEQQVKFHQSIKAKQDAVNKALEDAGLLKKKNAKETEKENKQLEKQSKTVKNQSKIISKLKGALGTFLSFRAIGKIIGGIINQAGAWIENLNLFSVTFNDQAEEMLNWAVEFSNRLGVSNNEIIKMSGLFKQVAESIGITSTYTDELTGKTVEVADSLSKTLTSLTYDLASFYNIANVKDVSEKLQSGIFAGQIRSVRSFGFDVSQESVQTLIDTNETLSQLGISARNLTQAQKAIARTIIILRDGENAFGDMARTIDSLQNRFRVLQGSFENLKLALGSALQTPVSDLLAYATGAIQAITTVIHELSGGLQGVENEVADTTENLGEALEETEDKANNLSFDKFESLTSSENENLTTTKALNDLLAEQQKKYEEIASQFDGIDEKVQSTKNAILDWVFPNRTEKDLGEFNATLQLIFDSSQAIAKVIEILAPTLGKFALKILDVVTSTIQWFENNELLEPTLVALITAITSYKLISGINTLVNSFKGLNGILSGVFVGISAMLGLFELFDGWLSGMSTWQKILLGLSTALLAFGISMVVATSSWSAPIKIPLIMASVGVALAGGKALIEGLQGFENGGIPNKSELFYMNENGIPEALINTGGSQTNVVNMQQLRQMTKEGFIEAINETGLGNGFKMVLEGRNIDNSSIARGIFPALKVESKRQGGNQL